MRKAIREGRLHPSDAIKAAKSSGDAPSPAFIKWASTTGLDRYNAAKK